MREQENITLRLPRELYEKLQAEAERLGLDMRSVIIYQLWAIPLPQAPVQQDTQSL